MEGRSATTMFTWLTDKSRRANTVRFKDKPIPNTVRAKTIKKIKGIDELKYNNQRLPVV